MDWAVGFQVWSEFGLKALNRVFYFFRGLQVSIFFSLLYLTLTLPRMAQLGSIYSYINPTICHDRLHFDKN